MNKENPTENFLALCKRNEYNPINILNTMDVEALIKIHSINSNFNKTKQINPNAYKEAKKILSKEIYETYIHIPKINSLKELFIKAFKEDKDFKNNIYESLVADIRLNNREKKINNTQSISKKYEPLIEEMIINMERRYSVTINREDAINLLKAQFGDKITANRHIDPEKKSKLFEQTTEEMKLYMEENHKIGISRKEAVGVLKSEFGQIINEFVKNEKNARSLIREKHFSNKSRNPMNNFYKSNLTKPKNPDKKVSFDI